MADKESLYQLWSAELERYRPAQDMYSFDKILAEFLEKILKWFADFLKLFNFNPTISSNAMKNGLIVVLAVVVAVIGYFLLRKFLPRIYANTISKIINRENVFAEYKKLLSLSKYSEALRELVKRLAESAGRKGNTFNELFRLKEFNERKADSLAYGKTIHQKYEASEEELLSVKKIIITDYPKFGRKLSRLSKDNN